MRDGNALRNVHHAREGIVYIGIGTVVLVLLIILIVWALRGRSTV